MKRVFLMITFCLTLLGLAACGPIYSVEYQYIPPKTDMARMCTAQCVQAKNSCEQMCQMRNDQCRASARSDAVYNYEVYKQDRREAGKKIKKDVSSFDDSYRCNSDCNCGSTYNSCYTACGGQILEKRVCTAFCDKGK